MGMWGSGVGGGGEGITEHLTLSGQESKVSLVFSQIGSWYQNTGMLFSSKNRYRMLSELFFPLSFFSFFLDLKIH